MDYLIIHVTLWRVANGEVSALFSKHVLSLIPGIVLLCLLFLGTKFSSRNSKYTPIDSGLGTYKPNAETTAIIGSVYWKKHILVI